MAKPKKANKPKKQKKDAEPLAEDMYDEVDAFHKQKDKIMLNGADDKDEDESEDDFGVYDLQNDSDDEDDSVDDDRLERCKPAVLYSIPASKMHALYCAYDRSMTLKLPGLCAWFAPELATWLSSCKRLAVSTVHGICGSRFIPQLESRSTWLCLSQSTQD